MALTVKVTAMGLIAVAPPMTAILAVKDSGGESGGVGGYGDRGGSGTAEADGLPVDFEPREGRVTRA